MSPCKKSQHQVFNFVIFLKLYILNSYASTNWGVVISLNPFDQIGIFQDDWMKMTTKELLNPYLFFIFTLNLKFSHQTKNGFITRCQFGLIDSVIRAFSRTACIYLMCAKCIPVFNSFYSSVITNLCYICICAKFN